MIWFKTISVSEVPTAEPVNLQEAKDFAEIDFTDKDEMLYDILQASRETVEDELQYDLIPRIRIVQIENDKADWDVTMFPYAKGISTVSLYSIDSSEVSTLGVLNTDYYLTDGWLKIPNGRFRVTYTTVPGTIKRVIKQAIKMEFVERYRHRGENDADGTQGVSVAAKEKLAKHRAVWL